MVRNQSLCWYHNHLIKYIKENGGRVWWTLCSWDQIHKHAKHSTVNGIALWIVLAAPPWSFLRAFISFRDNNKSFHILYWYLNTTNLNNCYRLSSNNFCRFFFAFSQSAIWFKPHQTHPIYVKSWFKRIFTHDK